MTDQQAREAAARLLENSAYQAEGAISYVIWNLNEEIAWKEKHPGARVHADFLRDMRRNVEEARDDYRTAIQQDDLMARRIRELEAEVARLRIALQRQIDSCDSDCVMCDEARAVLGADVRSEQA